MADKTKRDLQFLHDAVLNGENLCDQLDDNELFTIGRELITGYGYDVASRREWVDTCEMGLKLANMDKDPKTWPWQGCANTKYPLISVAIIQFAARAYPEIVPGEKIVNAIPQGEDPDESKAKRAIRVGNHMSYQLMELSPIDWEDDTDTLLHGLPGYGSWLKKTYWSDQENCPVSEGVNPLYVVFNNSAKSLNVVPRISHLIPLWPNEVQERVNDGRYREGITDKLLENQGEEVRNQENFLEISCWYDLDGDGYAEPWTITVHEQSEYVVSVYPRFEIDGIYTKKDKITRIKPFQNWTLFKFIPSFDGTLLGKGFFHLLGMHNESINTVQNQLLDSGTLNNLQGGFLGKGLRWQGGQLRFTPGEWKPIDSPGGTIRDSIVPLPVNPPSVVLFQLLGSLVESGMKLASVSDAMTGEMKSENTAATTVIALIEQGMKVYSGIHKRVFRSLKSEFKKVFLLNSLYLDENQYLEVSDDKLATKADYNIKDFGIIPVADPKISSQALRLAKAQAVMQAMPMLPTAENKLEGLRRYFEAIEVPEIEKLVPKQMPAPGPNPDMLDIQLKMLAQKDKATIDYKKMEVEESEAAARIEYQSAQTEQLKAQAMKLIAEAEVLSQDKNLNAVRAQLEILESQINAHQEHYRLMLEQQQMEKESADSGNGSGTEGDSAGNGGGGTEGMGESPADAEGDGVPAGNPQLSGQLPGDVGLGQPPENAVPTGVSVGPSGRVGANPVSFVREGGAKG